MPATLLIDRDGKIADVHPSMVEKDAFERGRKEVAARWKARMAT